eukprot:scaffold174651_cov18-Tisochrysis_lutea.AAC.1
MVALWNFNHQIQKIIHKRALQAEKFQLIEGPSANGSSSCFLSLSSLTGANVNVRLRTTAWP